MSANQANDVPKSLPIDGYSRWKDLAPFMPYSRETIRQREMKGTFPQHIMLSERCAAWPNRAIHEWLRDPVGYRAQ